MNPKAEMEKGASPSSLTSQRPLTEFHQAWGWGCGPGWSQASSQRDIVRGGWSHAQEDLGEKQFVPPA